MNAKSPLYELILSTPPTKKSGKETVLVHGLEGFSDAGSAVKLFTSHIKSTLDSELVARFDADGLLDYRSRRPRMSYSFDRYSGYDDPSLTLHSVRDSAGTQFFLLSGLEPDLKWEQFTTAMRLLAEEFGVTTTVGVNAIPMAVPHTRPSRTTAHSSDPDLIEGFTTWPGELSVPGSVSALLEFRMSQHGHPAIGFTAHVPHYLAQTEYPAAALKLVEDVSSVSGLEIPTDALDVSQKEFIQQISDQISGNAEVELVVTQLEGQYDSYLEAQNTPSSLLSSDEPLPSGDELGAEFEKFLAQHDDPDTDA